MLLKEIQGIKSELKEIKNQIGISGGTFKGGNMKQMRENESYHA